MGVAQYYTYLHTRNDTGAVFYVGRGMGRRAYDFEGRNSWWKNVVNNHGRTVHVLDYFDNDEDVNCQERWLISLYRNLGVTLVNLTEGGEGALGYKHSAKIKRGIVRQLADVAHLRNSKEARAKQRESARIKATTVEGRLKLDRAVTAAQSPEAVARRKATQATKEYRKIASAAQKKLLAENADAAKRLADNLTKMNSAEGRGKSIARLREVAKSPAYGLNVSLGKRVTPFIHDNTGEKYLSYIYVKEPLNLSASQMFHWFSGKSTLGVGGGNTFTRMGIQECIDEWPQFKDLFLKHLDKFPTTPPVKVDLDRIRLLRDAGHFFRMGGKPFRCVQTGHVFVCGVHAELKLGVGRKSIAESCRSGKPVQWKSAPPFQFQYLSFDECVQEWPELREVLEEVVFSR